jgi:hypothetical protein
MSDRTDFRISFYERQVERLVTSLRDLADQIERNGKPYDKPGVTGTPRHVAAAENVNHALVWGIANAGAHRLFDAAFHADEAEREIRGGLS